MRVYFKTILMLIKMQLEYRKAFIISVIGSFFVTFLLTLSVYFLFEEFNQIGDWSFFEVAFLFGMVYFAFSMSEMFFRGLDHFANVVKSGEFDRILIRPQNALIQSMCMEFDFSKIGRIAQSILVMIVNMSLHNSSPFLKARSEESFEPTASPAISTRPFTTCCVQG